MELLDALCFPQSFMWNWKLTQCFKMPLNCRELSSSCITERRRWHTKAVSNKLQLLNRLQNERIANVSLFLIRVCSFCKQTLRILYTSLGFVFQEFLSHSATILLKEKFSRVLHSLKFSSVSLQVILALKYSTYFKRGSRGKK